MDYQHKEAYCIMFYKCDKCHAVERFWNSRDGVTPFIVLARADVCRRQRGGCLLDYVPAQARGRRQRSDCRHPTRVSRMESGEGITCSC